ncbi:tRNA-uridine aminocarboxypropyltransferase [Teredinibacter sp. KSP-S5-2]|uniref:tRNA-uridine aminocarboxypropyltransferase n=1 Tax=Teredinibacter sp. KSP-S5-2 TaxID=3034506 RepID=UPI00293465E6|nr:DTW domain-containing protein [Teredinibacter sp. KSP-S5-2]WNO08774.1 DTW domain-containing protein [Teredinibacter sp. KSP-S5-2]
MYSNNYTLLRELELKKSTKPFLAKGKSVKRCAACQMAEKVCICAWRPQASCNLDFVLLMHRLELFKPTNTGRLIADVFPESKVYLWNRCEPESGLLKILNDPLRECFIVFPYQSSVERSRKVVQNIPVSDKKITLILLDGSWKQCSRMIMLSRWLDNATCLSLPDTLVKSYSVRDSGKSDRFSTAEAAVSCLTLSGEIQAAEVLRHYFNVFNLHYLATRGCYQPVLTESHQALQQYMG